MDVTASHLDPECLPALASKLDESILRLCAPEPTSAPTLLGMPALSASARQSDEENPRFECFVLFSSRAPFDDHTLVELEAFCAMDRRDDEVLGRLVIQLPRHRTHSDARADFAFAHRATPRGAIEPRKDAPGRVRIWKRRKRRSGELRVSRCDGRRSDGLSAGEDRP